MEIIGYVGLDVHKETHSACLSYFDGQEVSFSLLFTFSKSFLYTIK